jgi:hydroxymethylglutaryl-CoA synthase
MGTGVGIERLSFYSPHYYIDLNTLAARRGLAPHAFAKSIGQERMAVPPPGEDVVTMAANAVVNAIEDVDSDAIDMLIFGSETGIDQSKAAAVYVHQLACLPLACRSFEIKQACYGATAGLQMAIPYVQQNPDRKVVVVASDVARYGLDTEGEATQGGGALAMVISAKPDILELDGQSGIYTEDVMDFWRPNYRDEALVDGKASVRVYIRALQECWKQYSETTGHGIGDFSRFCYHLPFTRMAEAAHRQLVRRNAPELTREDVNRHISDTLLYNRITGNSYTASLYIALASLLDTCEESLAGERLAMFSYGSGCVAEFFSGVVGKNYRAALNAVTHQEMLGNRHEIGYDEYHAFYTYALPTDGRSVTLPHYETGRFRLAEMRDHQRIYEGK